MIERLLALETFGIRLGLDNISALCEALGHPERSFRSLHVAGTNGKGSVTAMTHAALAASGILAARYTSPHLHHLAERFVIGRDVVDEPSLVAAIHTVLDTADRLRASGALVAPPTFFEATTAVAFELFRRARTDVAVVEVGLGGRFDATNVIQPIAAAITTIGLDHEQHLGHTLEAIAGEKAGVIKPGITVVSGVVAPPAADVIRRTAADRGARLVECASVRSSVEMRDGRAHVTMTTARATYGPIALSLRGAHQAMNAVVATCLLEAAGDAGVPVTRDAIEHGLATASWPARLEPIRLPTGHTVLLDAAHNPEGARALAAYLHAWYPTRPPLVVSIMQDKDAEAILRELVPVVSTVIATRAPAARALPPSELAARAIAAGAVDVEVETDPIAAVNRALQLASTVCVAGSIFLAAPVREALERHTIRA